VEGECSHVPCGLLYCLGGVVPHQASVYVTACTVVSSPSPSSVTLRYGSHQHLGCRGGLSVFLRGCLSHVRPTVPSSALLPSFPRWVPSQWKDDTSRARLSRCFSWGRVGVDVLSHYEEGQKRAVGCKQSTFTAGFCVASKVPGKVEAGAGFHRFSLKK